MPVIPGQSDLASVMQGLTARVSCAGRAAGAGCTAIDGEDGAEVLVALEEAVSADLKARTSRAISIQVRSSV